MCKLLRAGESLAPGVCTVHCSSNVARRTLLQASERLNTPCWKGWYGSAPDARIVTLRIAPADSAARGEDAIKRASTAIPQLPYVGDFAFVCHKVKEIMDIQL